MSSPGYSAGASGSPGASPVNPGFPQASPRASSTNPVFLPASSMINQSAPLGLPSRPGTTNFHHGMHSFKSANELEYYLQRIGGPGSIVNITDASFLPFPDGSTSTAGNREGATEPGQLPVGTGTVRGRSSALMPFSQEATGSLPLSASQESSGYSGNQPVPPGYERNTYLVACELHGRVPAIGPPSNNVPSRNGLRRNTLIFVGYCDICRNITLQGTRGDGVILPGPM